MTADIAKPEGYGHLIEKALAAGIKADDLGKLLDLESRWHATQAERAYNRAMHAAQAEMPVVVRDALNTFTQKAYARLENVSRQIKPVYTKHGFVLSFSEEKADRANCIRVVCEVRHTAGHVAKYWMEGEPDLAGAKGGGNKTQVQGVGSTVSYLTRYLKLRIFDVTVADEDNDGLGYRITPAQIEGLNTLWAECEAAGCVSDWKGFLNWLGVDSLEKLPMSDVGKAEHELRRKLREKRK